MFTRSLQALVCSLLLSVGCATLCGESFAAVDNTALEVVSDMMSDPPPPPPGFVYVGQRLEEGVLFWEYHNANGDVHLIRVV